MDLSRSSDNTLSGRFMFSLTRTDIWSGKDSSKSTVRYTQSSQITNCSVFNLYILRQKANEACTSAKLHPTSLILHKYIYISFLYTTTANGTIVSNKTLMELHGLCVIELIESDKSMLLLVIHLPHSP